MTSNTLTEHEEHDISSQIWRLFWIACLSYFLDPNMVNFYRVLWSQTIVVNFAELIVYIIPTE